MHFKKIGDREICIAEVSQGDKPAYVKFDNTEEFYVRTGNSTTPLTLSAAASYIELWKNR